MNSDVMRNIGASFLIIISVLLFSSANAKVSLDANAGGMSQNKVIGTNQVAHHGGFHGYNRGFHNRGFNHGFHRRNFGFNRGFHNRGFNRGFHNRGFNRGFHGRSFNRGFHNRGFNNRGFRSRGSSFGFFFVN